MKHDIIVIRIAKEEKELIKKAARIKGVSVAQFIRTSCAVRISRDMIEGNNIHKGTDNG